MAWDFKRFRCSSCGSEDGFRSHRRSLAEKYILFFFLLRPARCGTCLRRCYRPLFTTLRIRRSQLLNEALEFRWS